MSRPVDESAVKTNAIWNDQLWQRFALDVFEDRANLDFDVPSWHLNNSEIPSRLCDYFRSRSRAARGVDSEQVFWPQHNDFLVVDASALQALLAMPKAPAPRFTATRKEWQSLRNTGDPQAFVWLIDSSFLGRKIELDTQRPGWSGELNRSLGGSTRGDQAIMQLKVVQIRNAWFARAEQEEPRGLPCAETAQYSGIYTYKEMFRLY